MAVESLSIIADFTGAFATVGVAYMVYRLDQKQHGEVQASTDRQIALERQALRLEMLERRSAAIQAIEEARQEWHFNGKPTPEMFRAIGRTSAIASLLYGAQLRDKLTQLSQNLIKHNVFEARVQRAEKLGDEGKRAEALDRQFEIEDRILAAIQEIPEEMIAASRIDEEYL